MIRVSILILLLSVRCHAYLGSEVRTSFCPNRLYSPLSPSAYLTLNEELWSQVVSTTEETDGSNSEVSTQLSNVPNGCQCVNDLESDQTCTTFICHETCNIHRGQCDPFCCSDPDCTAAEVKAFRDANQCLDNGSTQTIKFCYELDSLESVNAKYGMSVEQDDDPLSALMCVSVDNNPIEGIFLPLPNSNINNQDLFATPSVRDSRDFSFEKYEINKVTLRTIETNPVYRVGEAIRAARQSGSGLVLANGGFLSVPVAGPDGACVTENYAEYLVDVGSINKCVLPISDISSFCTSSESLLSLNTFTSSLLVGLSPESTISDNNNDGEGNPTWATVELDNILNKNLQTGSPGTVTTSWNAATKTCENAVVGIKYKISHTTAGTLSDFKVDVVLGDVTQSNENSAGITQTYEVYYIPIDSTGNETSITRRSSGNPGYIKGLPVQSGDLVTKSDDDGKSAIKYNYAGLQISGPYGTAGKCTDESNWWETFTQLTPTGSDTNVTSPPGASPTPAPSPWPAVIPQIPIMFGVDSVSSCTIEMTYEQFIDQQTQWCKDFSRSGIFGLSDTYIGIFGNSDPLKKQEWIPIDVDFSGLASVKFSPAAGELTCQNIISGLKLEILWANTGEITNPQAMILSARASFFQTDWTWKNQLSSDATQRFPISQTVTFLQMVSDVERARTYKPENPPILPAIPSDVFYPFDISEANTRYSSSNRFIVLLAPLCVIYFLQRL